MSQNRAIAEPLERRALLTTLPAGFEQSFITRLPTNVATSMDIAPDGRIFLTDNRSGNVRIVKDGKLLSTPFCSLPVDIYRERGLEAVELDPDFAQNGYVYVYYTHADPSNPNTAPNGAKGTLSRFQASTTDPDIADSAVPEKVILGNIGSTTGYHNGGFLHFGKDGMLYLAIGEVYVTSNSQDLSNLNGKMLRLDVHHLPNVIPADNPFVNTPGARGEIYALGLRNPFSGDVDPVTGKIFENDVGGGYWEEVNEIQAGANYGWPAAEGASTNPSHTNPFYAYAHNGGDAAITGGTFYYASQFPASYQGKYFFADYVNKYIHVLDPATRSAGDFASDTSQLLDMDVGPDGSLYCLAVNGNLYKIRYVGIGNNPPTAEATADKNNGALPIRVNFDGSASSDPNNDPLTYSWDFGDGSTGNGAKPSHDYKVAGIYNAILTVSDGHGGTDISSPIKIYAGNTAPQPVISLPAANITYAAGDQIQFSGNATDIDDPLVPDSAFHWSVVFHHETHTHPFIKAIDGVKSGSFQIPVTGETNPDQWYRIHLTVIDSGGLSADRFFDMLPRTSTFTLDANVTGLQLTLDGAPRATPASTLGVVGMTRGIGAPLNPVVNGKSYQFVSWSDAGNATHDISTPQADTTFIATYKEIPVVSLTAVADAYVRDGSSAGTNFGSATSFAVKHGSSGYHRETYLKFDLTNAPPIGSATLRMFGGLNVAGSMQISAYKTGTSWGENTIDYANRPAASGSALATLRFTDASTQSRQFDLTNFLKSEQAAGHSLVSIVLKTTSTGNPIATFNSRENLQNQPQLVISPTLVNAGTTLNASADSYVRGGSSASTNFGGGKTLNIKATSNPDYLREAYLRFDISSNSSINSARLRIFGSLTDSIASNLVTNILGCANTSWSESAITYSNRPATSGGNIASANVIDAVGRWYEFDITAYLKAQKAAGKTAITLVLRNAATIAPYTAFNSREATTNRPQLVIA